MLAARSIPPWISAHSHGLSTAAGWLYTAWGNNQPPIPWCTTTKPTAEAKGKSNADLIASRSLRPDP